MVVGVYAPHQLLRAAREKPTTATVDIVWKPRSTVHVATAAPGRSHLLHRHQWWSGDDNRSGNGSNSWQYDEMRDRQAERVLFDALEPYIVLEMYPRSGVSIVVQVLQDDGCLLGCALNAALMALMDAGVTMRGMPVAVHCGVASAAASSSPEGNGGDSIAYVMIDPDRREEEQLCHAWCMLAFDLNRPEDKQCVASFVGGAMGMSDDEYWACMRAAKIGARTMVSFLRAAMQRKIESTLPRSSSQFESKRLQGGTTGAADNTVTVSNSDSDVTMAE